MNAFAHDELLGWAVDVLRACGVSHADSATTAGLLIRTSLRGIDTHGIARLPSYVQSLRFGSVKGAAQPVLSFAHGALLVDGGGCLGQVAASAGLHAAMERAATTAAVACSIRNCGHLSALGLYALQAAEQGYVAMVCQNTPPIMAVPGASTPMIGNNPIAFAAPVAGQVPLVFDMASSTVARGRVQQAARAGVPIPEEWAVDADGMPTTDAMRALAGAMQPMAGHKGLGLAMLVQCLAASLGGITSETLPHATPGSSHGGIGAFLLVLNPDLFVGRVAFEHSMGQWLGTYMQSGGAMARYPGQRQADCETDRLRLGIPVASSLLSELCELGRVVGVGFPELSTPPGVGASQ